MNKKKEVQLVARLREKNKKHLLTAGSNCHSLLSMFSSISEKQKPDNFVSMTKMYL